jgi:putative ABC transport system permease protein
MTGQPPRRGRPRLFRLFRTQPGDVDDEIRFHLETRAEYFVRRGMSPDAAMAEARRRFGITDDQDLDSIRQSLQRSASRREERIRMQDRIETLIRDMRYALRGIRSKPGFATAIVLTLALGIGATTAIYSVVEAVILRPLPYADSDRVVMVWNHWTNWPRTWLSEPEVHDYAERTDVFQSFAGYSAGAANLTSGDGDPERIQMGVVQASFFAATGARPLAGRVFTKEEDVPNGPRVVVLGESIWRRRFGADRSIVGKNIEMNGRQVQVIGILPEDFRLPTQFAGRHAEAYLPIQLGPKNEDDRGSHYLSAVARLRPGITVAQAQSRITAYIEQFKRDNKDVYGAEFGIDLLPIAEQVRGDIRPVLLVLLAVVSFVLLIACANVANLLLSRAESRQREIAVRAALGASNGRIASQLLTESVVLAFAGGILGLGVAWLLVRAISSAGLANLPRADVITIDATVLAFAAAVSLFTGLLFGFAPVLHILGGKAQALLKQGRGNTAGPSVFRARGLLISAEVALAVVATAGAVLMARSFTRLVSVSPGFSHESALSFRLSAPAARYQTSDRIRALYDEVLRGVRGIPGVTVAGAVTALPLVTELGDWGISIEGVAPTPPGTPGPAIDWMSATPGYLEAMGTPIVRGRTIGDRDRRDAEQVVVVNEATTRKYFPGQDALDRRIKLGGTADTVWRRIVGISRDIRHAGLDKEVRPQMHIPYAQFLRTVPDSFGNIPRALTVVARTTIPPASITSSVRSAVRTIDPSLPVAEVRTLEQVFDQSVSTPRVVALLLGAFGALALLLSAIGVYGVTSYAVARRSNEIGIRVALGARVRDVIALITWQGMRPAVVGALLGVAMAFAGTRLMSKFLYGVSPTDATSLATAPLLLLAVGLLANWLPARRAARVDPVSALRSD